MEEIDVERMLRRVFDYQRFSPNRRLSAMIEEVENHYRSLDDEELSLVAAAGDTNITNELLEKKDEYADGSI